MNKKVQSFLLVYNEEVDLIFIQCNELTFILGPLNLIL